MALPAVPLPGYDKPGSSKVLALDSGQDYAWYDKARHPPKADGEACIALAFLAQLKAPASMQLGKRVRVQAVVVPRKKGAPPLDGGANFPFEKRFVEDLESSAMVVAALVYQGSSGDGAMLRVCGWIQGNVLKQKCVHRDDCVSFPTDRLLRAPATVTMLIEERPKRKVAHVELEEIEEVDDREFEKKRHRTLGANITPLIYLTTAADSPEEFRCGCRIGSSQFGDKDFRERALSCTVLRMRALLALHKGTAEVRALVDAIEALSPDDDYLSAFCLSALCVGCEATADRKRWLVRSEETLLRMRMNRSAHLFSSYAKLEVMLKRNRILVFKKTGEERYSLVFPEQGPAVGEMKGAAIRALSDPLVVRVDMQADETAQTREHAVRMLQACHGLRPSLSAPWIKLPFRFAGKYLANASVHVEGGWAYMPLSAMPDVLARWMTTTLEQSLERRFWNTDIGAAISKAFPGFRRECKEIGDAVPRARRAKKTAEDDIELPDIEDAMRRVMPLCVTNLHARLAHPPHHLAYWERLQLARILGSCGYPSNEVYLYMSAHASKGANYDRASDREIERLTQDMDKAKESRAYPPDHQYDLADRSERKEHAAIEGYKCNTYIKFDIRPDNHNGCPFAPYFDAKELERMLVDSGQLAPEQIKSLLAERASDPVRACNNHLIYRAMVASRSTEDQVRKAMRDQHFYVSKPKIYALFLSKLTEPDA